MTSVREASVELLRTRGMTTMFGNPGSTELPMLAEFPSDFGLPAAVGVQMAQPDRPVVCVIGEGSTQYAIAASAPQLIEVPVAPGMWLI